VKSKLIHFLLFTLLNSGDDRAEEEKGRGEGWGKTDRTVPHSGAIGGGSGSGRMRLQTMALWWRERET